MLPSLRSQFLVPLSLAILITVSLVAAIAYWSAAASARSAIENRLVEVARIASQASFPLTENVLQQMQDLSSLEIAVLREQGEIAIATRGLRSLRKLEIDGIVPSAARQSNSPASEANLLRHRHHVGDEYFDVALCRLRTKLADDEPRWLAVLSPHAAQQQLRKQAIFLPIITGVAAAFVTGWVATLLASHIRQRIDLLRHHVDGIAKGSFAMFPSQGSADEISRLADDINRMTLQLREMQTMISANQRSTLINQIASGMAHQLRNTLTGARLAVQIHQQGNPAEAPSDLDIAIDQLKLAEQTIQSLLQVRTGIDEPPTEPMPIETLLAALKPLVKNKAEHKGVDILFSCEPSVEHRSLPDGQSVLGALLNFILNALEAVPPSGWVRCEAKLAILPAMESSTKSIGHGGDRECCQFSITDNGPGPSGSVADTMFEPFVTTKPEGIGLGLPMARRTSQRLQGDLRWERRGDQTVFLFSIPLIARENR